MIETKKQEIIDTITDSIRIKLANYSPETSVMPFHTRLLGKDRMALYSFLQSLNTTFGTTIYEPVALSLADKKFVEKQRQKPPETIISSEAHVVIQQIMNELTTGKILSNKENEIEDLNILINSFQNHIYELQLEINNLIDIK